VHFPDYFLPFAFLIILLVIIRKQLIQQALPLQRHQFITATYVLLSNPDLRHRMATASLHHLLAQIASPVDVNLVINNPFAIKQLARTNTIRAILRGVYFYI
jgi:hypothetical protein